MNPETKREVMEWIARHISKQKEIGQNLEEEIGHYTGGGPIRSEKTELEQIRMRRGINETGLKKAYVIQELLQDAPINLNVATEWAEVGLRYEDGHETFVLLIPEKIEGVTNPKVLMVSTNSPIGIAIKGHSVGDRIEIVLGRRKEVIEVTSID